MKKLITLKYLKKYLSKYLWQLQDAKRVNYDYPDYSFIVFKADMDKALTCMEKELSYESDRAEVKEALKYILNLRDFDYLGLLRESAQIILNIQAEARDIFMYMWKFIFDEPWEYQSDVDKQDFIVKSDKVGKRNVANIIMQKKWHDHNEYITWDTQIFFNKDGTGTLSYTHESNDNRILLKFRYKIRENDYSNTTLILIHFPDLNMAFELAAKVIKAMTQMYLQKNGHSNVLKLSDNPFFLTQDFLNQKEHNPRETLFYQY
ncbi:MAG: hypothetical protein JXJ04_09080 [Spirochaetales bacterium]|nr:hypothetical protein [Spirochaetales bacterium]